MKKYRITQNDPSPYGYYYLYKRFLFFFWVYVTLDDSLEKIEKKIALFENPPPKPKMKIIRYR